MGDVEGLFNAASHGYKAMVVKNDDLHNIAHGLVDSKDLQVVLLCCLGRGLVQFSLSIFRDFHSLHPLHDNLQSRDMKYLLTVYEEK